MVEKKSLTICIPLFNEEEVVEELEKNLTLLYENLKNFYIVHFLLVNDGSSDSTLSKLNIFFKEKENFFILNHEVNKNLGGFLKTSINYSSTDYIAFLDSDSTFDPQLIKPMLEIAIERKIDIVNASHLHPSGSTLGVPYWRKFISIVANTVYRLILNVKIYTFTSILKIYKLEKIKDIDIQYNGFVAVTELFVKGVLKNLTYLEYPCTLTTRIKGSSKIKFRKTIITHIKFMWNLVQKKF